MNRLKSIAAFLVCWAIFGVFSAWFTGILIADPKHYFRDNGLLMYGAMTGFIFGGMMWGLIYPPRRMEPLPKPLNVVAWLFWPVVVGFSLGYALPVKSLDDVWPLLFIDAFITLGQFLLFATRSQRLAIVEEAAERLILATELNEALKQFVLSSTGRANLKNSFAVVQLGLLETPMRYLFKLVKNEGYLSAAARSEANGWLNTYSRIYDVVEHDAVDPAVQAAAEAVNLLMARDPTEVKKNAEEIRELVGKIKARRNLAFA